MNKCNTSVFTIICVFCRGDRGNWKKEISVTGRYVFTSVTWTALLDPITFYGIETDFSIFIPFNFVDMTFYTIPIYKFCKYFSIAIHQYV